MKLHYHPLETLVFNNQFVAKLFQPAPNSNSAISNTNPIFMNSLNPHSLQNSFIEILSECFLNEATYKRGHALCVKNTSTIRYEYKSSTKPNP